LINTLVGLLLVARSHVCKYFDGRPTLGTLMDVLLQKNILVPVALMARKTSE